MLEEDIALANVGLDYLGRARLLLGYAGELLNSTEDELAYLRDPEAFRNLLIVELPRGDFAFTMMRQYLLDVYEHLFFDLLARSTNQTLSHIAAKTLKEVKYHRRRSAEWVLRLGLGTDESHRRAQDAFEELTGYVDELFEVSDGERELIDQQVAVPRDTLFEPWWNEVDSHLQQANLRLPRDGWRVTGGRAGQHTEHLSRMLGEMQVLQRRYPGQAW